MAATLLDGLAEKMNRMCGPVSWCRHSGTFPASQGSSLSPGMAASLRFKGSVTSEELEEAILVTLGESGAG